MSLKPLVIRDEIHGDLSFDGILREVIDHDCFQRLRYIKQLGLAEYVFPCATHTRFQHSLGASYLASHYFESLMKAWLASPFKSPEGRSGRGKFFAEETSRCVAEVADDAFSFNFWKRTISLAGLLHDVGHGPWSHTFEFLEVPQDFSAEIGGIGGSIGAYFKAKLKGKGAIQHEDVSLLYIHRIFRDLELGGKVERATDYFLPVATLIHRKLLSGGRQVGVESELGELLQELGVRGGVEMHRLIRPLVSGPFDVDRIDYIQRDGRNCGVSIGGIEWRRIVTKLVPCLAHHPNRHGEPSDVVLISNMKNQHVLDDFVFSLFQMYAQVYLHPKIVGLEETLKRLLLDRKKRRKDTVITFDLHRSLSDERFRHLLKEDFALPEIEAILRRESGYKVQVASSWGDPKMEKELQKSGYSLVDLHDRPMMKDSMGLFLYTATRETNRYFVQPWGEVSPIANKFYAINYSPRTWVRWLGPAKGKKN